MDSYLMAGQDCRYVFHRVIPRWERLMNCTR